MKNKFTLNFLPLLLVMVFAAAACNPQGSPAAPIGPSAVAAETPSLTEATASPDLSAILSEILGKVEVKQTGQDAFSPATEDFSLNENGQVQTGDDGRVRLDISTGTIIRVAPASLFRLISNEPVEGSLKTRLELIIGQLFVVLNGGSLEVQTPAGTAAVRGSYMMTQVNPETGNITISCLEGQCSFNTPSGTIEFGTGEKITFIKDPTTGQYLTEGAQPMSDEDYQAWLDENPEFNQMVEFSKEQSNAPSNGADGGSSCGIISPNSGASLGGYGPVNFEWQAAAGVVKYVLTFTYPNGIKVAFETTHTELTRYLESMPLGGEYNVEVTGYKEDGSQVCVDSLIFEKDNSVPPNNPNKKEKHPIPSPGY